MRHFDFYGLMADKHSKMPQQIYWPFKNVDC